MADTKLIGSINLARLSNVGVMTIQGSTTAKKCVVIPIEENDIYVKVETKTAPDGRSYIDRKFNLGIEVYERQAASTFGETHYIKPSISKDFINAHSEEEVKMRNGTYIGGLKPVTIPSSNQAATVEAPVAQVVQQDDEEPLPF